MWALVFEGDYIVRVIGGKWVVMKPGFFSGSPGTGRAAFTETVYDSCKAMVEAEFQPEIDLDD